MRLRLIRALSLVLLALSAAACGDARRTITGREASAVLVVAVESPPALSASALALGWPAGSVPGARVLASRVLNDPSDAPAMDTALTDGTGVARFSALAAGRYAVRVERAISAGERARATGFGEIETLVGQLIVLVSGDSVNTAQVVLSAVGGSSLIFTEIFPAWPPGPSRQQYYFGGYLKIYNNADTTIQLARKSFIQPWEGYISSPLRPNGCSIFREIERDPNFVWLRYLFRFPDDTRALRPGESLLLVTDAIDHRPFGGAGFFNLTNAGVEFRGSSDADNPEVPNMIDGSARPFEADGHGWRFRGGRQVWGLAAEMNADSLVRWTDAVFGIVFLRVSTSAVLDLVRYDWDTPNTVPTIVPCPSAIASSIDPADAVYLEVEDTLAIHRRVARTLPNGRIIYQRSRNSAADWIAGKATPGSVP